jgi:hypothetical protein
MSLWQDQTVQVVINQQNEPDINDRAALEGQDCLPQIDHSC